MSKLYLVDATYELFRAYYAKWTPSRRSAEGLEVGAVHAMVSSVISLLRDASITHVACATDHVITSFRNDLFDGYKTGDGVEPALLAQFEFAEEALASLGIEVWAMTEFEADDAIASGVHRFASLVDETVICSPDKDFAQLVDDALGVRLLDRRRNIFYDTAAVHEKWGVAPGSIPDYLALVGDSADGIPGLSGWGVKSTAAVLSTYLRLEDIPDDAAAWSCKVRGAKKLAARLSAQREDARLYRTLATLRRDAPISEDLDALAFRGAAATWSGFCEAHGFGDLLERASGLPER